MHGSIIAHILPIQSSDECLHYYLYDGSMNDSANGSTIAHTIVHMNGSTTALPRLYSGSTNGSTDGSTNGSTNCSTVSCQRLYEWPCNGPAIAHKIIYTNGSINGPAMALQTALQKLHNCPYSRLYKPQGSTQGSTGSSIKALLNLSQSSV